MRPDFVVKDLTQSLRKLLQGLANGLTAKENFAPEGDRGQVLTSNGRNTPPSYQDIRGGISDEDEETLRGPKGDPGPQGPVGPAGATGPPGVAGATGMVPTYIGEEETFTIPENRQALFYMDIVTDGILASDGYLVGVD